MLDLDFVRRQFPAFAEPSFSGIDRGGRMDG
jgi:hypothetical protein